MEQSLNIAHILLYPAATAYIQLLEFNGIDRCMLMDSQAKWVYASCITLVMLNVWV